MELVRVGGYAQGEPGTCVLVTTMYAHIFFGDISYN
jgi:hypothetical protein